MRILCRHFLRSFRKKPLQPIVLILTLALSIATAVFAFTLRDVIEQNVAAEKEAKYGQATFSIGVGNTSESRFLFADDVRDVLGDDAMAVGTYELPLVLDGTTDTTMAVATEIDRVSDMFDVGFLEYGRVTKASVGDVAFVSAEFAQQKGLSIGDTLVVETMGYAKSYRIEGIAKERFLSSYDVMVDIGSVVRAFADQSLIFAAIGDDFKPCGKIYVSVDESTGLAEEAAIAKLKADARFADKNFEELTNLGQRQTHQNLLEIIVWFAVSVAVVLSSVVAFYCLYILANERAAENLTLAYAGASPTLLALIQYAEVFVYWLISVPLGVLLSLPLAQTIEAFVHLRYIRVSVGAWSLLYGSLIILGAALLTTTFFVVLRERIKKRGISHASFHGLRLWVFALVTLGLFVGLLVCPIAAVRLPLFVVTMASIMMLACYAMPWVLQRLAGRMDKKLVQSRGRTPIARRYALKNICSLKLLHNIARLCAMIVCILLSIAFVFGTAQGWVNCWEQVLDGEYVVANATDRCYEKTRSCESAEWVSRAYMGLFEHGAVFSADDLFAYGDVLKIDRQPTGNEAIIGIGIAHELDLSVGDLFAFDLDGVTYEVVVAEIKPVSVNYIALNCEDLGIPYNMLLVEGREGVSSAELLADLTKATAGELAAISSIDAVMVERTRSMDTYMQAGGVLFVVFLIFSLIGVSNLFGESLRTRQEEFELYLLAGMTRKDLRKMKIAELLFSVLIGLLVGLLMFAFVIVAIDRGMSALGGEIFLGIMTL